MRTLTELTTEIQNKLIILQCKHGTAQSDVKILRSVTMDIIEQYCTGQYAVNMFETDIGITI